MMSPLEGRNRVDGVGARQDAIAGADIGAGDWQGFEGWPITNAACVGWGSKALVAAPPQVARGGRHTASCGISIQWLEKSIFLKASDK